MPELARINWLGLAAVVVAFLGYILGLCIARRSPSRSYNALIGLTLIVLAIPAAIYDVYYTGLLGEPIWLYRLRTMPETELLACPAGLLAGWAQIRIVPHLRLSAVGKRFLVPVVLGFAIALPYLKPLLRPLRFGAGQEQWKGAACLQSTPSTCGPAAAATIVRHLGGNLSERELAAQSFTSRSGTENWYLARTLRRNGFTTDFLRDFPITVPLPAIAGVRLRSLRNSGHFIALLERKDNNFVIVDPMDGMATNTLADLDSTYEFTGFFLVIRNSR